MNVLQKEPKSEKRFHTWHHRLWKTVYMHTQGYTMSVLFLSAGLGDYDICCQYPNYCVVICTSPGKQLLNKIIFTHIFTFVIFNKEANVIRRTIRCSCFRSVRNLDAWLVSVTRVILVIICSVRQLCQCFL